MTSKEIEYNEDELKAPEWLNENFFLKVLKNCEKNESFKITKLEISPGTGKNDHYASIMFRAVLEYSAKNQTKTKSMIVKTMPEVQGNKMDLLEDSHIFKTEIGVYKDLMPKFIEILRQVGDETELGPKCLYHQLEPIQVIVFEDLVPLGYVVIRDRLPNIEEVRMAYSKLAKWHAISYKLNLEQPELFNDYRYGCFNTPGIKDAPAFKDGVRNFLEMLDEHSDLTEYKKYFLPLKDNILDYCEMSCSEFWEKPNSEALYVLCHGDAHLKNMMFRQNGKTGHSDDVLLLDYQVAYVGPIGNDILYSMYLLMDEEMRADHLDELFYLFFKTFQETLSKIGFKGKIPTIIKLREELTRHRQYNIFLMMTFLPMWLYIVKGIGDIGAMMESESTRKLVYKESYYVNEMRRLLPRFLHLGYFEDL